MKCHKCNKKMEPAKDIPFNEYKIDGWKCQCGEVYFRSEQAQKVLILNKLKKTFMKVKLGKIRSNLILRLPKIIEQALNFKKGEEVTIRVENDGVKIMTN